MSDTVTGMTAETNSVSITAPRDGILMISANVWLYNPSTADQFFSARIRLEGQEETHLDASNVVPNKSAGRHAVTLDAVRSGGTGDWSYTSN